MSPRPRSKFRLKANLYRFQSRHWANAIAHCPLAQQGGARYSIGDAMLQLAMRDTIDDVVLPGETGWVRVVSCHGRISIRATSRRTPHGNLASAQRPRRLAGAPRRPQWARAARNDGCWSLGRGRRRQLLTSALAACPCPCQRRQVPLRRTRRR